MDYPVWALVAMAIECMNHSLGSALCASRSHTQPVCNRSLWHIYFVSDNMAAMQHSRLQFAIVLATLTTMNGVSIIVAKTMIVL